MAPPVEYLTYTGPKSSTGMGTPSGGWSSIIFSFVQCHTTNFHSFVRRSVVGRGEGQ
jgi:hypothetical protein